MMRSPPITAGAALSTDLGQTISPASFSLRVGNACVLVTILPKNVLLMSSQKPLLSPLAILRTPELFCSLIGMFEGEKEEEEEKKDVAPLFMCVKERREFVCERGCVCEREKRVCV